MTSSMIACCNLAFLSTTNGARSCGYQDVGFVWGMIWVTSGQCDHLSEACLAPQFLCCSSQVVLASPFDFLIPPPQIRQWGFRSSIMRQWVSLIDSFKCGVIFTHMIMCFIIEICMHPFELNIVVCSQMTAGVILSAVDFTSPSILLGQLGLVHNTEL